VGRDSLSLFTSSSLRWPSDSVFSPLGDVIESGALACIVCFFSGYVPLWGVFLRNEIEEDGIVFKGKKKNIYIYI
jgi:hypothetical protein